MKIFSPNRRAFLVTATLIMGILTFAGPGLRGADAQTQSDLDRIVQTKVVKIGAVESYPNYRKDLKTGEWIGIIPDFTKLAFGSIGVKVEFVPTDWGSAVAGLQSGRFDLIGAYGATPERALAVDFTNSTTSTKLAVLTLKNPGSEYNHWSTLNTPSFKIGAVEGGATTTMAQKLLPNASWTLVKTYDAMILQLESGRVDAIVSTETILDLYRNAKGAGNVVAPQDYVWTTSNIAVRRGSGELRDWLNVAIAYYTADGTLNNIYNKYMTASQK